VHAPVWQITALPHEVPSFTLLHIDVLVPGWHDWHALLGFFAPDA
jgi:hypothetical protein